MGHGTHCTPIEGPQSVSFVSVQGLKAVQRNHEEPFLKRYDLVSVFHFTGTLSIYWTISDHKLVLQPLYPLKPHI